MNRLSRHATRVRSPLRGRSAKGLPFGQTNLHALITFRQRPSRSSRSFVRPAAKRSLWQQPYVKTQDAAPIRQESGKVSQDEGLLTMLGLYAPDLFKMLDQPWKEYPAATVLVFLLLGIGSLAWFLRPLYL